jgi:hypothetical protein
MFRDQLYVNPGPIPARQRDRKSSPGVTLTIRATSFCISIEGAVKSSAWKGVALYQGPIMDYWPRMGRVALSVSDGSQGDMDSNI